jgi:putative glycosyltransferase (TIGR04372 family)
MPPRFTCSAWSWLVGYPKYLPILRAIISHEHLVVNYYRDIHNFLDRSQSHLKFTPIEEKLGRKGLQDLGIPVDAKFVCLIVRDSRYYNERYPSKNWDNYEFRNCSIENFILAAEKLAALGYYVVRMGASVQKPLEVSNPKVVDYANSGKRNEFMDIYLGAKCYFCISTGTGFDEIPNIFRRPIVYTNYVSIGRIYTFSQRYLCITKTHWCISENRRLSLKEIFSAGLGFCSPSNSELYEVKGVKLIENSPQQVLEVVTEMLERLEGTWKPRPEDEELQEKFWNLFPRDARDPDTGERLHGEIRSRFGTHFLRADPSWID